MNIDIFYLRDYNDVNAVASALGICKCTVYRWVKANKLAGYKVAGRLIFTKKDVLDLFKKVNSVQ